MAIIGKIRERSGLVVVIIGIALVAFLLTDFLSSRFSIFGGPDDSVGVIDGKKISYSEFEQKLNINEQTYMINQDKQDVDESNKEIINEQTWNQLIQEQVIDREYEKLGLVVTDEEVTDFTIGEHPHPQIQKYFTNPQTQQFDRDQLILWLKNRESDQTRKMSFQWYNLEKSLVADRLNEKYTSLIKGGIYVTKLEGKEKFVAKTKTAEVKFVGQNYSTIPDSAVTLSEDDLKDYLKRNIEKYKAKESTRSMEYVVFEIVPSAQDTIAGSQWASQQLPLLKSATNDSLFISLNSETKWDTLYYPKGKFVKEMVFTQEIEDSLLNGPEGTVVGPFYSGGKFRLAKLVDVKDDTMQYLRASHILFKIEGATDADTARVKKKAEEVMAEIKGGKSFEEMARLHGTDGTASQGGDLGWFPETGAMIPEFSKAVKDHKKGDIFILKTKFGIHIIKVTENATNTTYKIAILDKSIEPGKNTLDSVADLAFRFASTNRTEEDFQDAVLKQKLTKRVIKDAKESDKTLQGLDKPKPLLRWAFEDRREKGDVSDAIDLNNRYVVAMLTAVNEKGKAELENVRAELEPEAIKEKKAEMLTAKIEEAMKDVKSMEELALKLQTVVQSSPSQTFDNMNIEYVGPDLKVLGTIFGMQPQKFSEPVTGDNGVYVIWVVKFTEPALPKDFQEYQAELLNEVKSRSTYEADAALRKYAKIEDRRSRFY